MAAWTHLTDNREFRYKYVRRVVESPCFEPELNLEVAEGLVRRAEDGLWFIDYEATYRTVGNSKCWRARYPDERIANIQKCSGGFVVDRDVAFEADHMRILDEWVDPADADKGVSLIGTIRSNQYQVPVYSRIQPLAVVTGHWWVTGHKTVILGELFEQGGEMVGAPDAPTCVARNEYGEVEVVADPNQDYLPIAITITWRPSGRITGNPDWNYALPMVAEIHEYSNIQYGQADGRPYCRHFKLREIAIFQDGAATKQTVEETLCDIHDVQDASRICGNRIEFEYVEIPDGTRFHAQDGGGVRYEVHDGRIAKLIQGNQLKYLDTLRFHPPRRRWILPTIAFSAVVLGVFIMRRYFHKGNRKPNH